MLEELGEKEDDPNGTPDAEPAELTAMGAQDAADAEAVLNQLMRTGANVAPPTGGEEGSSAEFFEEIRKLLADFNVSIQEESKLDILTFLPPSETGDSHHRYIRLWECPPPPLALPAQDSVPR